MKKHVRPLVSSSRRRHAPSPFGNNNALSVGLIVLMATLGLFGFMQLGRQQRRYDRFSPMRFSNAPDTERWRDLGDILMQASVAERPVSSSEGLLAVDDVHDEAEVHDLGQQVAAKDQQQQQQPEQQRQQASEQQQLPPPEQQQPQQPQQQEQQQQLPEQQPEQQQQPQQQHQQQQQDPQRAKTRVVLTLDYHDMAGAIGPDDDFETACEKSGKNVGNLVWLYSASHYIMDPEKNELMSPKTRKGDLDAVVIPSANILWNMSDLDATPNKDAMMQSFATMRPTTTDRTPRFIIGIGVKGYEGLGTSTSDLHGDLGEAYTRMYTPSDYVLHSQYVTTLSAIAADAKAIGVRGLFTETLLRSSGVGDAMALGCPSLFLNPNPTLGATIQAKIAALGPHSRVAFNMPQRWLPRLMTFLLRMAMQSERHMIIWQSPTDMWFLQRAEKELGIVVPREKIKWFRDFESWSETMCRFDAIVGSRIHGNMIGVACPTPMLLIASDIRTHEMGGGMKIPMLQTDHAMFQELGPKLLDNSGKSGGGGGNATKSDPKDLPTLAQLFEAARFDGAAFDTNRYLQASRYNRILTGMKIEPSERIRALAVLHQGGPAD